MGLNSDEDRPAVIAFVLLLLALAVSCDNTQRQPKPDIGKSGMHINFERSGGFAGMRIAATIDAETLPPSEARKMRELVEAADFFNLPSVVAAENAGPDRFQYKVTVKTEGRSHTVETHETGAPPSMRPLLDWLTAEARKEKK